MRQMALSNATALWDVVSAQDVARTLGSASLRKVRTEAELVAALRKGFPADVMSALRRIGFTIDELAAVTANSTRTINRIVSRRETQARLNLATSNAALRLASVVALAEQLIGSRDDAVGWLRDPNRYLGQETPLALLETEIGRDLVIESLYAVAFGAVG